MDDVCEPLKKFDVNLILENDTPYDIDFVEIEYKEKYNKLFGKLPPCWLFTSEIRKRCKKINKMDYDDFNVEYGEHIERKYPDDLYQ